LPSPRLSVARSSVWFMAKQPGSETVREWIDSLASLERDMTDAQRIDLLRALEALKSAAAATQVRAACDFDASQRAEQAAAGEPATRVGRGVAEQVALARRESPSRGGRCVGAAKALVHEMPHTLAALATGRISERRAEIVVRETACLDPADRATVDTEIAGPGQVDRLEGMGDRALANATRRIAYRLDPAAVTNRARKAERERRVTLRPAPDTMSYLTALLPVAQGVACIAALTRASATARAAGDPRSRGQVMADALVAALTQPDSKDATDGTTGADGMTGMDARTDSGGTTKPGPASSGVSSISLQLVMTDRSLFGGDSEPAHLVGYGTVPAGWARDLLRSTDAEVWLRRLYTHPATGDLLSADSRARLFTGVHREVLVGRDQTCRTPWCDAPVRHVDHPIPRHRGGPTSQLNSQGLCEQCNYAKEAPGWSARATSPPRDRHTVTTTTPTGHRYRSRAPAPPGTPLSPPETGSHVEYYFTNLLLAA
jgi:5-methylcytosine-specific restriction endonuclease McrA